LGNKKTSVLLNGPEVDELCGRKQSDFDLMLPFESNCDEKSARTDHHMRVQKRGSRRFAFHSLLASERRVFDRVSKGRITGENGMELSSARLN
jgi:hypothetical protein